MLTTVNDQYDKKGIHSKCKQKNIKLTKYLFSEWNYVFICLCLCHFFHLIAILPAKIFSIFFSIDRLFQLKLLSLISITKMWKCIFSGWYFYEMLIDTPYMFEYILQIIILKQRHDVYYYSSDIQGFLLCCLIL